ncbi:septum formation family protein, partial [Leifsonia poae]
ASAADTPTTKLDTREIAALLSARTGDPDPDNVATRDQPAETPSEPAGAGPDAPANAPQTGAVPPLEDATLLMGALPSPATQQLDAESLADASEPVTGSRPAADSILFPELAPTAATTVIPSSSSAAGGAAQSTTALPTPAQPGGTGGGTGGASGSDGGAGAAGNARTNRLLLYVAGGLAIVLVLIGLFALGTRLPTLFAGPAAAPVASATTKPTPSRTPTPTPTPTPTVQPKPAGPQPAGVRAWNTLGGGECIQPYSTPWAETFTVVDCATPHAGQMIYTNILSADPAAAYPGADALAAQINALCTKPGILDLNAAAAYPNLQIQGTFPATAEQWKAGQRSYYCFVSRAGGEPMTSSVAGPGPTG